MKQLVLLVSYLLLILCSHTATAQEEQPEWLQNIIAAEAAYKQQEYAKSAELIEGSWWEMEKVWFGKADSTIAYVHTCKQKTIIK